MSSPDVLAWVVALGVGAIFAELVRSGFQRRKMGADAAKVITDAATALLVPLQTRVAELETLVESTRRELDLARRQVALLTSELEAVRNVERDHRG